MIPEGIAATPFFFFTKAPKNTHPYMYTHTHKYTRTHTYTQTVTLLIKTVFSSVEVCQASTVGIPAESSPNKP